MELEISQTESLFSEYSPHLNRALGAIFNRKRDVAEKELKILRSIIERSSHPDDLGLLCIAEAKWTGMHGDSDGAAHWLNKALEHFRDLGDPKRLMLVWFDFGMHYFGDGKYQLALDYYKQALEPALELRDQDNIANIWNSMGEACIFLDQNRLALEYTTRSLRLRQKLGQTQKVALSMTNIVRIYNNLEEYEKSIEMGLQALALLEKNKPESRYYGNMLNTMGITYYLNKEYDKALEHLFASLEVKRRQNDRFRMANTMNGIGNCYINMGRLDDALRFHQEALAIREEKGQEDMIGRSCLRLGKVYLMKGDLENARHYTERALSLLEDDKGQQIDLYAQMTELEQATGHYKPACEWHERHFLTFRERTLEMNRSQIAELRTQFELEQKEREAALFREKNHELEAKNHLISEQKEALDRTLQELKRSERNLEFLSSRIDERLEGRIIGQSESIRNILDLMAKVASAEDTSVLIMGESGTGKELVAKGIHEMSARKDRFFHGVNTSAITSSLFESEFFGYEKNAFTGATDRKAGWFEAVNGGTLMLDEIGSMPMEHQIKLLRVLEERSVTRVGARNHIPVDVRIISASNTDLLTLVSQGTFREDLYHRLSAFVIQIPPLRERKEDIQPLLEHFVNRLGDKLNKRIKRIEPRVVEMLKDYHFPGNVRELRNIVERALILCDSPTLQTRHITIPSTANQPCHKFSDGIVPLEEIEREMILRALRRTNNNQTRAARLLGVSQKAVERRIKKFNLRPILEQS